MIIVPFAVIYGVPTAVVRDRPSAAARTTSPSSCCCLALFTVTGGIHIKGNLHGSPSMNTALLAIGTVLAGWMGTTGASMLLIRPMIRANDDRKHKIHVFVFFIFLVSNIGGALTPLGDPPLFLGFLKGVSFFWTTQHLFAEMLVCAHRPAGAVLCDRQLLVSQGRSSQAPDPTPEQAGPHRGWRQHHPAGGHRRRGAGERHLEPRHPFHGLPRDARTCRTSLRDLVAGGHLLPVAATRPRASPASTTASAGAPWWKSPSCSPASSSRSRRPWPSSSVGKDGAPGAAGRPGDGTRRPANDIWYFWLTGILSSFLDNAPTYLVFFNLAGGDPNLLMGALASTLAAISCGAVFMGANSYIGNAPNFMVKAVVEEAGIRMPSFFGYMAWSCGILLPLFLLTTPGSSSDAPARARARRCRMAVPPSGSSGAPEIRH